MHHDWPTSSTGLVLFQGWFSLLCVAAPKLLSVHTPSVLRARQMLACESYNLNFNSLCAPKVNKRYNLVLQHHTTDVSTLIYVTFIKSHKTTISRVDGLYCCVLCNQIIIVICVVGTVSLLVVCVFPRTQRTHTHTHTTMKTFCNHYSSKVILYFLAANQLLI